MHNDDDIEVSMTSAPPRPAVLSDLAQGQCATITGISPERGTALARRLSDLGLEEGRCVVVGRRAPLGDPTVYRVADYQVSLRRREAALVRISLLDAGADQGEAR